MEPIRKYVVGIYSSVHDSDRQDQAQFEDRHDVYFDEKPLLIDKNNPDLFVSPDFDWGSRSRGSKQTALSILLQVTDNVADAVRFADLLVSECLCLIPSHKDFKMQIYALQTWLKTKKNNSTLQTDILYWTKIDDPKIHRTPPAVEKEQPKIIEPPLTPVLKSIEPHPQGGKMEESKYPYAALKTAGSYFYFLNPTKQEMVRLHYKNNHMKKRYQQEYTARMVTSEWAKAHGIDVAQENITIGIVIRIK